MFVQALAMVTKDPLLLEECITSLIGTTTTAGMLQLLPYNYNVYNYDVVHNCVEKLKPYFTEKGWYRSTIVLGRRKPVVVC